MGLIHTAIDIVLHLDKHLNKAAGDMGAWLYLLLFGIIFAETGFVVTPFLPGDSLLFGVGALSATPGSPINLVGIGVLLTVAAVVGDAVNYAIGKRIGPKVFSRESSRVFNKAHLMRAHEFYERYGGKTIIIARFVPIVRTFAPFVAGIGQMTYAKFAAYNVIGAVLWVWSFLLAGWRFGKIQWIQDHFAVVTVAIVVISCVPVAVEVGKARWGKKRGAVEVVGAGEK